MYDCQLNIPFIPREEVAEKIANPQRVLFKYLDITMDDGQPVYSYQVKEGIYEEWLDLLILKRKKIIELLKPL